MKHAGGQARRRGAEEDEHRLDEQHAERHGPVHAVDADEQVDEHEERREADRDRGR